MYAVFSTAKSEKWNGSWILASRILDFDTQKGREHSLEKNGPLSVGGPDGGQRQRMSGRETLVNYPVCPPDAYKYFNLISVSFEFQFQKFEVVVFAERRYEGKMYLSIRYGNKRRQL